MTQRIWHNLSVSRWVGLSVCLTFCLGLLWQVSPGTLLFIAKNIQGLLKINAFSLELNIWCAVCCNFNPWSFLYNYGGVTVLPISPEIFPCWRFNLLLWDCRYLLENLLKCITKSRQHAWKNNIISTLAMEWNGSKRVFCRKEML